MKTDEEFQHLDREAARVILDLCEEDDRARDELAELRREYPEATDLDLARSAILAARQGVGMEDETADAIRHAQARTVAERPTEPPRHDPLAESVARLERVADAGRPTPAPFTVRVDLAAPCETGSDHSVDLGELRRRLEDEGGAAA